MSGEEWVCHGVVEEGLLHDGEEKNHSLSELHGHDGALDGIQVSSGNDKASAQHSEAEWNCGLHAEYEQSFSDSITNASLEVVLCHSNGKLVNATI